MGKFLVKQTKSGFKFDLKAGNGETIATSEVYTTEAACMNGVESVRKNAPAANVEDQTVDHRGFGRLQSKVQLPERYRERAQERL